LNSLHAPRPGATLLAVLAVLSPSKSLDFESKLPKTRQTLPRLLDGSMRLAAVMKTKSVAELARMSHTSGELAALNAQRWAEFAPPFTEKVARPAVLAFSGDVYQGLAPRDRFATGDYTEAQKTIRILSGLYGVLRPLDLIRPYRLEMGTKIDTERGKTLYDWWGAAITRVLKDDLAASPGSNVLVNLASGEYFASVRPALLGARIITPRFEDTDARGGRAVISFYAKRARGEFAAWLVLNRVRSPRGLDGFDSAGYRYDPHRSTPDEPVFVRTYADRP
jgi:cytoplasmic iron level regulating protein YaaA (DUF328/UPF0246 family)